VVESLILLLISLSFLSISRRRAASISITFGANVGS
jgi:hypothetical protein